MDTKKLILGISFIIISSIILFGYLINSGFFKKEKKPKIIEGQNPINKSKVFFEQTTSSETLTTTPKEETNITTTKEEKNTSSFKPLIDKPLDFLKIDYPFIYFYDSEEALVKQFNIENEVYKEKEIFKVINLEKAVFSPQNTKLVFKTDSNYYLLDLKKDLVYNLNPLTKEFIFLGEDLILYLNNNLSSSYLAFFKEGIMSKIIDLGIVNPRFEVFNKKILIYSQDNPVFSLSLEKKPNLNIFLDKADDYSLLSNSRSDLLFVSFKENNSWKSKIINAKKEIINSFEWGTAKEKCSFDDQYLICALPSNLDRFDINEWLFSPQNDSKLIIYNLKDKTYQEKTLKIKLDIVNPQLKDSRILFWDRLSRKFYQVNIEDISFN